MFLNGVKFGIEFGKLWEIFSEFILFPSFSLNQIETSLNGDMTFIREYIFFLAFVVILISILFVTFESKEATFYILRFLFFCSRKQRPVISQVDMVQDIGSLQIFWCFPSFSWCLVA